MEQGEWATCASWPVGPRWPIGPWASVPCSLLPIMAAGTGPLNMGRCSLLPAPNDAADIGHHCLSNSKIPGHRAKVGRSGPYWPPYIAADAGRNRKKYSRKFHH